MGEHPQELSPCLVRLRRRRKRTIATVRWEMLPHASELREGPSMERRLAAVLIADVVGYGRLSQIDEEGTRARFQARPPLWVHGHMHESQDCRVVETRILCNPRAT
jgi:hypothetical protein